MIISKLNALGRRFASDEQGVTAVEYGVIGALIIVVCIAGITLVGTSLAAVFGNIAAALTAV